MRHQVDDDHVGRRPRASQRARGPRRAQDRRRRPQPLGDVRGQPAAHRDHADPSGLDLVELGLLAIADEQRDLVAATLELEGGVDDQALGPADAQARADERDVEGAAGGHRKTRKILPSFVPAQDGRRPLV